MPPPFITRVTLRNYKSIAACQVDLGPLMFLVGRNGSGKSNFLDAIQFVADALRHGLDHALEVRGGIDRVLFLRGKVDSTLGIHLNFILPSGDHGHYGFEISLNNSSKYYVNREDCVIVSYEEQVNKSYFLIEAGKLSSASILTYPAALPDRLFLASASGLPEFRPVFDLLSWTETYSIQPQMVSSVQRRYPRAALMRNGGNSVGVFKELPKPVKNTVIDFVHQVLPSVALIEESKTDIHEYIIFKQLFSSSTDGFQDLLIDFPAIYMSDGTLRFLGILLALFQKGSRHDEAVFPYVIGLEEPEMALHPGAAKVLLSAMFEASRNRQILVSSHSPDILDTWDITSDMVLAVDNTGGATRVGSIDTASREILREKLGTAGELLRQNQLELSDPEPPVLERDGA